MKLKPPIYTRILPLLSRPLPHSPFLLLFLQNHHPPTNPKRQLRPQNLTRLHLLRFLHTTPTKEDPQPKTEKYMDNP